MMDSMMQGANAALSNAANQAMDSAQAAGMSMARSVAEDTLKHRLYDSKKPELWGTDPGLEKSLSIAAPLTIYEVDRYVGCCDSTKETARSYTHIQENRIESNKATNLGAPCGCSCLCKTIDLVSVRYFDTTNGIMPPQANCGNCFCPQPAPIEVFEDNWMCCFMKLCTLSELYALIFPCCCAPGTKIVYVPVPRCCCGLCMNRASWCTNCCGMFGLMDGTPFTYATIIDGIKDREEGDRACRHLNNITDEYGKRMGWSARMQTEGK